MFIAKNETQSNILSHSVSVDGRNPAPVARLFIPL